ncbi:TonB-dependent receptor plug domain-containing protein [Flagellimonas sp. DF-77]|uniref:TonB-dependent receptor n=1 Tax=Flagellimonas algarum TaxID=3230298 RepID=UPI003390EBDF
MKKLNIAFAMVCVLVLCACSATKNQDTASADVKEQLEERNRGNVPLLTKIRQLPGVTLRNGTPIVTKATNSVSNQGSFEPLYVLNNYIVGNSFASINELVDNFNVKKVEVLSDQEAAFYGSRAATGVIKITTFK